MRVASADGDDGRMTRVRLIAMSRPSLPEENTTTQPLPPRPCVTAQSIASRCDRKVVHSQGQRLRPPRAADHIRAMLAAHRIPAASLGSPSVVDSAGNTNAEQECGGRDTVTSIPPARARPATFVPCGCQPLGSTTPRLWPRPIVPRRGTIRRGACQQRRRRRRS